MWVGPTDSLLTNRTYKSGILSVLGYKGLSPWALFPLDHLLSRKPGATLRGYFTGLWRGSCVKRQRPSPTASKRLKLPSHGCVSESSWKGVLQLQSSFHLTSTSAYALVPGETPDQNQLAKLFLDLLPSENMWDNKHLLFEVTKFRGNW